MQERQKYINELLSQLKEWDKDNIKLELKMNESNAVLKEKIRLKIEEVKRLKESAFQRIREIQHSSENTRKELKSGKERAFKTVKDSLESVKAE